MESEIGYEFVPASSIGRRDAAHAGPLHAYPSRWARAPRRLPRRRRARRAAPARPRRPARARAAHRRLRGIPHARGRRARRPRRGLGGDAPGRRSSSTSSTSCSARSRPQAATVKVRRDAEFWTDLLASIPGFELQGSEYRRPHWINVWEWTRERAARARRPAARWQPPTALAHLMALDCYQRVASRQTVWYTARRVRWEPSLAH